MMENIKNNMKQSVIARAKPVAIFHEIASLTFARTGKGKRALMAAGVALALLFSLSAKAETITTTLNCPPEVGTLFKGKNAGVFCLSKIQMTWWSAFSWCEAIGGKLPTWKEACPGYTGNGFCENVQADRETGWIASPVNENQSYAFNKHGQFITTDRGYNRIYALCMEK